MVYSVCPNIERLEIADVYFRTHENATGFLGIPSSLTKLKHIEHVRNFIYDEIAEYDFGVEVLAPLFQAAPNLASLRLHHAYNRASDVPLALKNLTELDLEYAGLELDAFTNLIRFCPRLERLKSAHNGGTTGDGDSPTPREAKDAVLTHALKLKSFYLDTGATTWEWEDEEVDVQAEFAEAKEELAARGIEFTFRSDLLD